MTTNQAAGTEEFLTRTTAATLAHVSTVTLDKLLRRPGAPPSLKVGRRVLIPRATFVAWINSQTVEGVR